VHPISINPPLILREEISVSPCTSCKNTGKWKCVGVGLFLVLSMDTLQELIIHVQKHQMLQRHKELDAMSCLFELKESE
jgi:hypothetical protein